MFQARSSVIPIPVTTGSLDSCLTSALIPALEAALSTSKSAVKAVLITNPSNPLSQCYSKSCIEECIKFCHRHGLHYISDEVYALTRFSSADLPNPEPFISALAIDIEKLGCDMSRIHTVWSTSKDFGQSGVRMVSLHCIAKVIN
jgi:gliotoxin/aspirochlorine biosynthesis aminotransferase